ncbi:Immunity protein 53 [Actinacidiphila alni]|uniref:Immunity protein 53 n=1 Tax=Actinacidiphila alni TaxID=380248 RepID=A0A1I2HJX1_9ACTN|nr:immunity 53 family protein [Actinacidiphila alni]SFF30464.1 Immunity protein 53 [Actinacidiphila alni]
MSSADALVRLQDWYASNCDGDWEHSAGVRIESLDNPGWMIRLDTTGTVWEGRTLDRVVVGTSEDNWLHYWADGNSIQAACGPHLLEEALQTVLDQVST